MRTDQHRVLHHAWHHFWVALAVASVVGLAHSAGLLGWLDSAMLRLTGATAQLGKSLELGQGPEARMPKVLLITEAEYTKSFSLRSPLDRRALAELLERSFALRAAAGLSETLPRQLVIDIDVAHDGVDPDGQAVLDDWLKSFVQVAGTALVLPLPPPSEVASVRQARLRWVRQACGWGGGGRVRFASAEVFVQGGQVLRYGRHLASLGTVAAATSQLRDGCSLSDAELAVELDPLTQGQLLPLGSTGAAPAKPQFSPFNGRFFLARTAHEHRIEPGVALPAGAMAGKTVFLGGAYEGRDRHDSPWSNQAEPLNGVSFHAATYFSSLEEVSQNHAVDALVDIFMGFAAGWVFSWLWAFYRHTRSFDGWLGFLVPKLVYAMVLVVALALAALTFWLLAPMVYTSNRWLNPGPIILGVLVKVVLSADAHDHRVPPEGARMLTAVIISALAGVWLYTVFHH